MTIALRMLAFVCFATLAGCVFSPETSSSSLEYEIGYVGNTPTMYLPKQTRYVFHQGRTCDIYTRTGNLFGSAWSDWSLLLGSAPYEVRGTSVLIDWEGCGPGTSCASQGANQDDEVLEVQSSGLQLVRNANGEQYTYDRESK